MDIGNFYEIELSQDDVCKECNYTIIAGSIAYQESQDPYTLLCSPCYHKKKEQS